MQLDLLERSAKKNINLQKTTSENLMRNSIQLQKSDGSPEMNDRRLNHWKKGCQGSAGLTPAKTIYTVPLPTRATIPNRLSFTVSNNLGLVYTPSLHVFDTLPIYNPVYMPTEYEHFSISRHKR
ncbi:hypothetical protein RF11_06374 [Thelohanellus kitauei]|uniref:Uncharacterized protein n=1 Tax=Thelohanellus kitauei TaxID=669202 RepID=A0A0C2MM34_THEKT|nr:hypothetical protein RF11_06374 [Thelohanellus kitauei]